MGRYQPFSLFNSVKGVDQSVGVMVPGPITADAVENLHVDVLGQWTCENQGFGHFSTQLESGANIDAMTWYVDDAANEYLIAAVNGKLKNLNVTTGATTSEIATTLTVGTAVDFQAFKGTLYAATSTLTPQKWAGSGNTSSAGGIPLVVGGDTYAKPSMVEAFSNRLVYGNFNGTTKYPSHIALSDDLAPETFTIGVNDTNAVVLQVNPGDGQALTGMKTLYHAIAGKAVLLLFKDRSIYALDGHTPTTMQVYQINPTVGCLNNRCVIQVGSDIMFIDQNNIYSITTAIQNGTIQPAVIGSISVKDTLASLNLSAKDKAYAIHMPQRKEVWFAIPTGSNTQPDTVIVYHYNLDSDGNKVNSWSIKKPYNGSTNHATCAALIHNTLVTGSSNGYVNKWFLQTSYGGQGVPWTYKYQYNGFNTLTANKRVVELFAWFLLVGPQTITIKTQWRGGGSSIVRTLSKNIGPSSDIQSIYGSSPPAAIYGLSPYGADYILTPVKIAVLGNGLQLQLTIQGTAGDTGVVFLGVSGVVEYGNTNRKYA